MTRTKKGDGSGYIYCWSCGTDLRRVNELHHKEIGHNVEWLAEHPKRKKDKEKIDDKKVDK